MLISDAQIRSLLRQARTLAVVGISDKPDRPSHDVSLYMQHHGYRIVCVNPVLARKHIRVLGQPCYASLMEIPASDVRVDMVVCFRKPEEIGAIAQEAIAIGAGALWQQLGIHNQQAVASASAAGLACVADRCIKIEHRRFFA
jgi:predicted CoA-binding protein